MRRGFLIGAVALAFGCTDAADEKTRRTYYIAADEVGWDYAPGGNLAGEMYAEHAAVFLENVPYEPDSGMEPREARIGPRYLKALYREYTDETFTMLAPVGADWSHLGTLGPLIRAEVGDTIEVVFRNQARFPYSMHPHGVRYDVASEGISPVAPGETVTYLWEVPERAGPEPGGPSSVAWLYHSHIDESDDTYAGLIGAIVVTRAGEGREDASPRDVDRELVTLFHIYNENFSQYLPLNASSFMNMKAPEMADLLADGDFFESNLKHGINGRLYGNLEGLTVRLGERVRWYVLGMGTEIDVHTPHWHGATVTVAGVRSDMAEVFPASMIVADMVPDTAGTWLYHCHVNDHLDAGMIGFYTVEP
jgi:manganese oxidase